MSQSTHTWDLLHSLHTSEQLVGTETKYIYLNQVVSQSHVKGMLNCLLINTGWCFVISDTYFCFFVWYDKPSKYYHYWLYNSCQYSNCLWYKSLISNTGQRSLLPLHGCHVRGDLRDRRDLDPRWRPRTGRHGDGCCGPRAAGWWTCVLSGPWWVRGLPVVDITIYKSKYYTKWSTKIIPNTLYVFISLNYRLSILTFIT